MTKTILTTTLSLLFAACALSQDKTDTVQSNICTIEDQVAGYCSGPFSLLMNYTRDTAVQNGGDLSREIEAGCYMNTSGTYIGKHCYLKITDVPFCGTLVVECNDYTNSCVVACIS